MNPKQKLRKEADQLFKEAIIKLAEDKCEVCGGTYGITAHHFFPRGLAGHLHYEIKNGVCLCMNCHFSHHTKSDPRIHQRIIAKRTLLWYNSLEKQKNESHSSFKTLAWYNKNIDNLKKI